MAGPGKGPAGESVRRRGREIEFQANDKAVYMRHENVDSARRWLGENGIAFEVESQTGIDDLPLTTFWGKKNDAGEREMVACFDEKIGCLVLWNTGAYINPECRAIAGRALKTKAETGQPQLASPAGGGEEMIDLLAGII
jgi:hypothetical protein